MHTPHTPPAPENVVSAKAETDSIASALARQNADVEHLNGQVAALKTEHVTNATAAAKSNRPAPKIQSVLVTKIAELDTGNQVLANLAHEHELAIQAHREAVRQWTQDEVAAHYAKQGEAGRAAWDRAIDAIADLLRAQGNEAADALALVLRELPRRDYGHRDAVLWTHGATSAVGAVSPLEAPEGYRTVPANFITRPDAAAALQQLAKI